MSDIRSDMHIESLETFDSNVPLEVLKGSWIGSFDSLRLVDPPQGASAQITLPDFAPGALIMCVQFDSNGRVRGETRRNRSNNEIEREPFTGTASIERHSVFQWPEGAFTIERNNVVNEVQFVLRADDEMQIILGSSSGTIPGNLAQCILKRV